MSLSASVPTSGITFAEPGFNQDPYPALESIRAAGPVVYAERLARYLITSYAHCAEVLKDVESFNSQGSLEFFTSLFGGPTMETEDDRTRHRHIRQIWATDFRRDALEGHAGLIADVVEREVAPFAERVRAGERVDAVSEMTRRIPTLVIAKLLGTPDSMLARFSTWSDDMAGISQGLMDGDEEAVSRGRAAAAELNGFIATELERRASCPSADLIGKLVDSEFASSMTQLECVANGTQLVFAGNETTAKLMASTLVALAEHPEQRQHLVRDPTLIGRAFEEVHRWQTLSQTLPRHAVTGEAEVGGVRIPRGSEVMPLLGAANRDPDRWDRPAEFDITRRARPHLGFGFGLHTCIGMHLARLEAEIWLGRLLELLPDFSLAGRVDYGSNFIVRGPLAVELVA